MRTQVESFASERWFLALKFRAMVIILGRNVSNDFKLLIAQ
jgi:hypothetical protein